MKHILIWMPLIVMALFMVLFAGSLVKERPKATSPMVGQTLPILTLHSLKEQDPIALTEFHAGKPFIINLFASWCQPCLAEHPFITQLSKQNVPFLGIAWKDTPAEAQDWLSLHGNPFQFITQDPHGEAAIALGISGVPESFLIDKYGIIRGHWRGPLQDAIIQDELLPLWNSLHDTAPE